MSHTGMNSLFGELDAKMATMLAGVDSLGVKQTGKSFILAFDETLADNEGSYTSSELLRLMGKTFFFLSGTSVYSRIVPGFVDLGLGNAGKSYDHSVFTAAAAAATIIASDTTNHIATINKLGTTAEGNIQTGTWWTDIGHTHNHYVSLFDYSLQAHTIDVSGTPYYIRESYTGSNVPQGTFSCVPEKKLELGLAEIIIEGPTSVTIETTWNKYRCWRIHNLSQNACTVTIHGTAFVIPRWGCKTIRKLADGSFVNPYHYFVEFQAGDPLFYWFWRTQMGNPYATGSGAYANLDSSNVQPTACNSMYANNISNPAVLHDWVDSLSRNAVGKRNAAFIRDITQVCDSYDRYSDYYGDPSDNSTIVGDLIHHKGKLVIARISRTTANPDFPTLPNVVFEEFEFRGYATIVADFAAHQIDVSFDGSNHMVLTSLDPDNAVTLISISTNLLKRGEHIPDTVNLSTLDGYTTSFNAAPYNILDSPYTIEYEMFDSLCVDVQAYWDGYFPRCFALSETHPVVIKQRLIVTAANQSTCGNAHKATWIGAFDALVAYSDGDIVSCRGQYWYSIGATPAGNTPSYYAANGTDPNEYWGRIEGYASVWSAGSYKKGDLVQGVQSSPNALDGMLLWEANSNTSDTPPSVGSPANGWNTPAVQGGDLYHVGSGYEVIDVGNELEQLPIAVILSTLETFSGTDTETTQIQEATINPAPALVAHSHTVEDLLNLVSGSFYRDPTQAPDSVAVLDSASLRLTPSGLVLIFRERIPNNNTHSELGEDDSKINNYGESILPPNMVGSGFYSLLQTEYLVSSDGLWLERWRRINFRGHGWGHAQRVRLYSDYITTIDDAPIPSQHGTMFASPRYGRAACLNRVSFGDLPDGLDYSMRAIFPNKTGIRLTERFDIIKNFRNTDGRNWYLDHTRGDHLVSAATQIRNEPGIKDRKNALVRHVEAMYFMLYYSTQGWIEEARNESAFIITEHWNAMAEVVNQCTRAIPLSWQCLKFYHDGAIRGLYDSDNDLIPSTGLDDVTYRPMEAFCGLNTFNGSSSTAKSFYQNIGIAIETGPPSGLPGLYSTRTKYRSVDFNWESEVEALSHTMLTLPADPSGTQLLSKCDYSLSLTASLGSEDVLAVGSIPGSGSGWLFDGPQLQAIYAGIEWVNIDDVKTFAEALGFGFSHSEIVEPYDAVGFSINDSISDGSFNAPTSGVSAVWNGLVDGGVYNLRSPFQARDMTYGFTLTNATFAPYDATKYLITPTVDESHYSGVQQYLVHFEYEQTSNPGVILNTFAWWGIGEYPYDNAGYPNPSGPGFTAPKSWFDGSGPERVTQITNLVAATADQTYYDPSITRDIGTVPAFCSGVQTLKILSAGVVFSQHNLSSSPKWKKVLARMNHVQENYWDASIFEAYHRTNRGYVSGVRSGNENIIACEHPAFHQFRIGATADSLPSNPDGYGLVTQGIYSSPLTGCIYGQPITAFVGNAIPTDYTTHIPNTYKSMSRGECFKTVKMGGTNEHFTKVALGENKIIGVQMYASDGIEISVNLNYIPKGFWAWGDGGYGIPDSYESSKEKYLHTQTQYKHAEVAGYQSNVAQTVLSDGGQYNGGDGSFGYYGFTNVGLFGKLPSDTDMFDLQWIDPTWPGFKGTVELIGGGNMSSTGALGGNILTSGVNLLSLGLQSPNATYPHGSMYEMRAQLAYTVEL